VVGGDGGSDRAGRRSGRASIRCLRHEREIDFGDPVASLASVERWLEVRSTSPELVDPSIQLGGRTVTVDLDLEPFVASAEGRTGARETVPIAIHSSMLPGIDWALRSGGRALLALGSRGLERELVLYTLVRHPNGSHFFAGHCQFQSLTSPLKHLLGARYDSVINRVIGKTDPQRILAAFGLHASL
jgi:hypothetical protein